MYKLANGWTKEKVMVQIKKYNNGSRAHDGVNCKYLTDAGNRCAIGCFIPDGHKGLRNNGSVFSLLGLNNDLIEYMPFNDQSALEAFQGVHDSALGHDIHERIQDFLTSSCEE